MLSPYSIYVALAMTYAGANGLTANQMAHVLHFTLPQNRVPAAFKQLARDLGVSSQSGGSGFQMTIASSLWGEKTFAFLPAFLEVLEQQYDSPLRPVNFVQSAESARQAINEWASKETTGKIPALLPAGSLDPTTRLVLANAVYFKANWQLPFAHEDTSPGDFRLSDGSSKPVVMMHQTATFPYLKTNTWQVVELPYVGERYSMVALLPQTNLARG